MERKHLDIGGFIYIGKEANKIEGNLSGLDTNRVNVYNREALVRDKIVSMTLKDAKKRGIPRRIYYRLRKASQKGKTIKLRNKTLKKVFGDITLNINYSFHILIR